MHPVWNATLNTGADYINTTFLENEIPPLLEQACVFAVFKNDIA